MKYVGDRPYSDPEKAARARSRFRADPGWPDLHRVDQLSDALPGQGDAG